LKYQGSGTPGSPWLADWGDAAAIDAAENAIRFCHRRYGISGVDFRVLDLNETLPLSDRAFDVIFCSNVMEHLINIDGFLAECRRIITSDGVMVAAVPPIVSVEALEVNLRNTFHITHLTPLNWYSKLKRYFEQVRCFRHGATGGYAVPGRAEAEARLTAEQTAIRESDFEFEEVDIIELNKRGDNITAVFVVRGPRDQIWTETLAEHLPQHLHIGRIFAKLIEEERANTRALTAKLEALGVQPVQASTSAATSKMQLHGWDETLRRSLDECWNARSWQLFAPVRNAIRRFNGLAKEEKPEVHDGDEVKLWIDAIRESTSWELLGPMRAFNRICRRLKGKPTASKA
jgi:SAM-dependent methyltransferase